MKKRIVLIVAMLLCATLLLASCGSFGKKESGFNGVINKDWVDPDDVSKVLAVGEKLSLTEGTVTDANGRYIVLENTASATPTVDSVLYIYDYKSGSTAPMLTLENKTVPVTVDASAGYNQSKITRYFVDLMNADYVAVMAVTYDYVDQYSFSSYYDTYSGYTFESNTFGTSYLPVAYYLDEQAKANNMTLTVEYRIDIFEKSNTAPVYTVDNATAAAWAKASVRGGTYFDDQYEQVIEDYKADEYYDSELGCDLVTVDNKVYKLDEDGNKTLVKDFGISAMPSNIEIETEEYYIEVIPDRGNIGQTYVFYNKTLEKVFTYSAPKYGSGSAVMGLLNNGTLIVQYSKQLHTDAKSYDYRNAGDSLNKFDLVTLTVDPKTGEEKEIDLDFVLVSAMGVCTVKPEYNYLVSDIENIALGYHIDDDKMINRNRSAVDLVSMNNKGKILDSVKFDSSIIELPTPMPDGYYYAENINGDYVIFAADGTVVNTLKYSKLNNLIDGKYILEDNDGIYDVAGNKLYDLKARRASSVDYLDGGVFMVEYDLLGVESYDIVIDGVVKQTFSISDPTAAANRLEEVEILNDDIYYTCTFLGVDASNGNDMYEYKYYNTKGEVIATFGNAMGLVAKTDDYVICSVYVTNTASLIGKVEFYKFSFTEA